MGTPNKWNEGMLWRAYRAARGGLLDAQIAEELGVSSPQFNRWTVARPHLAEALITARQELKQAQEEAKKPIEQHLTERLPPHLLDLWNRVNSIDDCKGEAGRINAVLNGQSTKVRQQLFLHALLSNGYSMSIACRKVGIRPAVVHTWMQSDPDFEELIKEVENHKDDFYESSFVELVRAGNVPATIHAAKTRLKHRGYGESKEVIHTGTIEHNHRHAVLTIDPEKLGLSVDCVKELLTKIREAGYVRGDKPPNLLEFSEDEEILDVELNEPT